MQIPTCLPDICVENVESTLPVEGEEAVTRILAKREKHEQSPDTGVWFGV
jgi:hypothetical protein